MKKLLNLGRSLLAIGLAAVMFTSTAAFGMENYEETDPGSKIEGHYFHDCTTGETTFVPWPEDSYFDFEEPELKHPGTARWTEEISEQSTNIQPRYQDDNRMVVGYPTLDWFAPTVSIKIVDENKKPFREVDF